MAYHCIASAGAMLHAGLGNGEVLLGFGESFAASEYNTAGMAMLQRPALICCLPHIQAWLLSPQQKTALQMSTDRAQIRSTSPLS